MLTNGADYLSIVEHCYESHPDDASWISRVVERANAVLDLGAGLCFYLYRERNHRVKVLHLQAVGAVSRGIHLGTPFLENMTGEPFRQYFYPRQPVTLASPIVAKLPLYQQFAFRTICSVMGTKDLLGMLGYPIPGYIFVMSIGVGSDHEVTSGTRAALQRIRIHVESGLRLRLLPPEQAVAVLSTEGKVLHLEEDLKERAKAEQLVHQAKTISRVRTRRERSKDDALQVWTALVEGRWSVVERADTDGKRMYFAYENAPQARAYRALTPSEATVLDQSIQGLPGKYVAYSTGLPSSRISEQLLSAANKLGFRTRNELVRVASSLRATGNYDLLAGDLTPAEDAVLRLVKKGLSNREIADLRQTSSRTIANQVSSLLRKVGVGGRRGLIGVEPKGRSAEGDDP